EGGCLVLNDEAEAKLAEKYRLQGVSRTGLDGIDVDVLGGKYNMTDLSAAIGLGQFKRLDEFNAKRKMLAQYYFAQFQTQFDGEFEAKTGAELPIADFENSNWHMFHIVLPESVSRADFMQNMLDVGIGLGYHYRAIHLFSLYRARGFTDGMFPIAERVGKQIVTLPLFPAMEESDVARVVSAIKTFLV
ncbi:MAG: DegT/DnrJ/EryC1/StrS aminotransferase family protein, partial [Undibacterium sp.]|nr:DegT/DnrJ/EryC1/StrS aminotransferase family protein [Undibacterium sp.]